MNGKRRILIVEDEEINQFYLQTFLSKKYEVYTCGSVNTFYLIISKMKFDLILMDVSLNDIKDGIQLTKDLRKNPIFMDTPIIVLSSNTTHKTRDDAMDAGANNYLNKPINGKTLTSVIDEYLLVN